MTTKIVLKGEPKSTQHAYKATCKRGYPTLYMERECIVQKEYYAWQAHAQWKRGVLDVPMVVHATFYFKTNRKQDLDNHNKLWIDSLTGIVWTDDSLIHELHLYKDYDKSDPRIELTITEKTAT